MSPVNRVKQVGIPKAYKTECATSSESLDEINQPLGQDERFEPNEDAGYANWRATADALASSMNVSSTSQADDNEIDLPVLLADAPAVVSHIASHPRRQQDSVLQSDTLLSNFSQDDTIVVDFSISPKRRKWFEQEDATNATSSGLENDTIVLKRTYALSNSAVIALSSDVDDDTIVLKRTIQLPTKKSVEKSKRRDNYGRPTKSAIAKRTRATVARRVRRTL